MRFIELVEHYLEQRKDEIHSEEELIKEKKLVPLSFSPFTHKLSLFVCVCVCVRACASLMNWQIALVINRLTSRDRVLIALNARSIHLSPTVSVFICARLDIEHYRVLPTVTISCSSFIPTTSWARMWPSSRASARRTHCPIRSRTRWRTDLRLLKTRGKRSNKKNRTASVRTEWTSPKRSRGRHQERQERRYS